MENKEEIIKNYHEIPTNFVLTVIMLILPLDLQYKIVIIEKKSFKKSFKGIEGILSSVSPGLNL